MTIQMAPHPGAILRFKVSCLFINALLLLHCAVFILNI